MSSAKKFTAKISAILAVLVMGLPHLAFADGMMVPPPGRYIYETGQKAVIFFENGTETLIISPSFKGDAEDFAWLVPTPSKPQVSKSSDELFASLQKLTAPVYKSYDYENPLMPNYLGMEGRAPSVSILETQKIDYYDITVLSANDRSALTEWLNKNGYQFPEYAGYLLDEYIKNQWNFTAVKIDNTFISGIVNQQLKEGHAIPLQMVFKTDKPVYPLKISQAINDGSSSGPVYSSGKFGMAIRLGASDTVTYSHNSEVDLSRGTVSFWLRPGQDYRDESSGIIFDMNKPADADSGTSQVSPDYIRVYKSRNFLDVGLKLFNKAVVWRVTTINNNTFSHFALSFKEGNDPLLFVNGEMVSIASNGGLPLAKNSNITRSLSFKFGNYHVSGDFKRDFGFSVDEFAFFKDNFSADQLKELYAQNRLSVSTSPVISTHFDGNLKVEKSDGQGQFVFSSTKPKTNYYPTSSMVNVLLYVFTPDKKQQVAGFNTDYAGWVKKDDIKNLATLDGGRPWIEPSGSKYVLTKLSDNMGYSEMNYDLYLKDAADNVLTNSDEEKSRDIFWVAMIAAILLIAGIIFMFLKISNNNLLTPQK